MANEKSFGVRGEGFMARDVTLRSRGSMLPPALQRLVGAPAVGMVGQGYVPMGEQSQASMQMPEAQPTGFGGEGGFDGFMSGGGFNPGAPLFSFRSQGYADGGMVDPNQMPMMPGVQPGMPMGGQPQAAAPVSPEQLQSEVQRVANANPQMIQQLQGVIMQALQMGQLDMAQLNMAVELARAAAQNPQLYPRLRQLAIQRGLAAEDDLPMQYDQGIVFAFLLAGEAVQRAAGGQQAAPQGQGMANGGAVMPGSYAAGGGVATGSPTGDQTGRADDIPIRVSGGEYVIPKHVVMAKGTEFFDKLLAKYDNNPNNDPEDDSSDEDMD